jgi:fatty acid desaturase
MGSADRINWYRTPLDRETLARLNRRSDLLGFLQVFGHLGIMCATAGLALYGAGRWPWPAVAAMVFLHGMVSAFMINAVHELVHHCVFKTARLNSAFARVFAFVGWINHEHFVVSHMKHHQYTLHPPDDLEVVLPIRLTAGQFWRTGFINVRGGIDQVKFMIRLARGTFEGEWESSMFPDDQPEKAVPVVRWARFVVSGHLMLFLAAVGFQWWLLPVVVSLTPFYGSWLFFLLNNTQHVGLKDNVPDFRLCCRTFTVNPVVGFLYWHMNFHTEHHMYAAVPCYRLKALHEAIRHELPPTPRGIIAVWREISAILRKQEDDPSYQHAALIPGAATPSVS